MRLALKVLATAMCPIGLWCFDGEIQVRVVDPQGLSVSGARVEVRGPDRRHSPAVASTSTDGIARFEVDVPIEITVQASGFDVFRERIERTTADPAVIRLRPAMVRSSIDVIVRDDPDTVTTVGSNLEIERTGARTVFDAVEQVVPGVSVTRRGVMGYGISTNGTGGVTIRGIGESPNTGVLVVVDGRPDFQGLMGHPLPDFYSLSDAGSVSVTEGPASVLYGSNAMGGVVEVKNWEPPEGMSTRLTASLRLVLHGPIPALPRRPFPARLLLGQRGSCRTPAATVRVRHSATRMGPSLLATTSRPSGRRRLTAATDISTSKTRARSMRRWRTRTQMWAAAGSA